MAHGGSCVARWENRVVFVRHALPGERVRVCITEEHGRYLRADVVEVLEASAGRVEPPCPYAGPGRCGGCDWQHATLEVQRRLKAAVVEESLARFAGVQVAVTVEPLPDPDPQRPGLGWRTRVRFAVGPDGTPGLHPFRSHQVLPVERCLIAHPGVEALGVEAGSWPGASAVTGVAPARGPGSVLVRSDGRRRVVRGEPVVHEDAAGRTWAVPAGGFWQVHPRAADTLAAAVRDVLEPRPGESLLDLYAGVGLFAGAVGSAVGPNGRVVAVESDRKAAVHAAENLRDLPWVSVLNSGVRSALAGRRGRDGSGAGLPERAELVVLDPPRSGAGAEVVRGVARREPRAVAYVACDPVALARDVATFAELGYRLSGLRAFDLFPMTAHVECVAVLSMLA